LDIVTVKVEDVDKVPDFEGSFELGRVAVAAARGRLARAPASCEFVWLVT
jgi:hypothetical protein